ncbi:hypothetical protein GCM10010251_27080 [Streptomyces aurantiogriseus]|uniref:Uncharacterized protein n=1 Tax=Streptomyces aurantiogriseus TaxID=66870 RepID=A0A918F5I1_9ACTN|nr:hypothetical protein GCM10010251_27080 [Streptomyces aurantiogriseus]
MSEQRGDRGFAAGTDAPRYDIFRVFRGGSVVAQGRAPTDALRAPRDPGEAARPLILLVITVNTAVGVAPGQRGSAELGLSALRWTTTSSVTTAPVLSEGVMRLARVHPGAGHGAGPRSR